MDLTKVTAEDLLEELEISQASRRAFRKMWVRKGRKCGGSWICLHGGFVEHCGHPTALFPYVGYSPSGETILNVNGRAFPKLIMAQVAVLIAVIKHELGGENE